MPYCALAAKGFSLLAQKKSAATSFLITYFKIDSYLSGEIRFYHKISLVIHVPERFNLIGGH